MERFITTKDLLCVLSINVKVVWIQSWKHFFWGTAFISWIKNSEAAEACRSSDPLNLSAKHLNIWEIISLCLLNDPLKLHCHPQLYEKYYKRHFCMHHLNLEKWKPQQKDLSVFLMMLFALVTHKATAIARYEFLTENWIGKGILQQSLEP